MAYRAPCPRRPNFDPSVSEVSYGCVGVATRPVTLKKKGSWLPLLDVCLRQQRDARTASLQPQSSEYSSEHKPRKALQAARHASTKTTSTALVHLGPSPSPYARKDNDRSRKDNETTVDAATRRDPGPAARQGLGLRAQARQGLRRRPPQRHGHGPGWENCGARCGRSQG